MRRHGKVILEIFSEGLGIRHAIMVSLLSIDHRGIFIHRYIHPAVLVQPLKYV